VTSHRHLGRMIVGPVDYCNMPSIARNHREIDMYRAVGADGTTNSVVRRVDIITVSCRIWVAIMIATKSYPTCRTIVGSFSLTNTSYTSQMGLTCIHCCLALFESCEKRARTDDAHSVHE
jgi:uncharacterized membrane protein YuzA (DUF378 family)